MVVDEAIVILKDWIKTDRQARNHSTESDFDQFCEVTCFAIEVLINEVEKNR